jgi:hypothetical protein
MFGRPRSLVEGGRSRSFPKVAATMNRAHDCLWNSFNVGAANKNLMSVKSCPTKNGKGRELVARRGRLNDACHRLSQIFFGALCKHPEGVLSKH